MHKDKAGQAGRPVLQLRYEGMSVYSGAGGDLPACVDTAEERDGARQASGGKRRGAYGGDGGAPAHRAGWRCTHAEGAARPAGQRVRGCSARALHGARQIPDRPAAHAAAGGDGWRQAEDDHLLVRRVLHSRLRAGPVRVLPEGHGPGTARPGGYSMSPYHYTASQLAVDGINTVQLADAVRQMELAIVPGVGNMAYQWNVGGRNYLYFPYTGLAEFARAPRLCGVPFLGPWANRLDGDAYWANGKRYLLNPNLGNLRRDGNQKPIHGVLGFSKAWQLVEARADGAGAWATSRLEFWRHPEMMAQFPFAHTLTITYRLRDGVVEVETAMENHGTDPMPVAVGFHPYFHLHDAPRDEWHVHLAARDHLVLNAQLIPTGERKPVEFADPHALSAGP